MDYRNAKLYFSHLRIWSEVLQYCNCKETSQEVLVVKNPPANAGDGRDSDSVPGRGGPPGGGHGNPRQYSCLENPMDRGTCHTQLKWLCVNAHITAIHKYYNRGVIRGWPWKFQVINSVWEEWKDFRQTAWYLWEVIGFIGVSWKVTESGGQGFIL